MIYYVYNRQCRGGENMKHIELSDNLSERGKTTVALALILHKLKPEHKNYIAAMSEGMLITNKMFEKVTDTKI